MSSQEYNCGSCKWLKQVCGTTLAPTMLGLPTNLRQRSGLLLSHWPVSPCLLGAGAEVEEKARMALDNHFCCCFDRCYSGTVSSVLGNGGMGLSSTFFAYSSVRFRRYRALHLGWKVST